MAGLQVLVLTMLVRIQLGQREKDRYNVVSVLFYFLSLSLPLIITGQVFHTYGLLASSTKV